MRNLRFLKKKDLLVELIQVKGHSGIHGNQEADRLTLLSSKLHRKPYTFTFSLPSIVRRQDDGDTQVHVLQCQRSLKLESFRLGSRKEKR